MVWRGTEQCSREMIAEMKPRRTSRYSKKTEMVTIMGTTKKGIQVFFQARLYAVSVGRISSVGSVRITRNLSMKMISNEEEIFVTKEKETQMFLFLLLIVHVVFLLPLNIFK